MFNRTKSKLLASIRDSTRRKIQKKLFQISLLVSSLYIPRNFPPFYVILKNYLWYNQSVSNSLQLHILPHFYYFQSWFSSPKFLSSSPLHILPSIFPSPPHNLIFFPKKLNKLKLRNFIQTWYNLKYVKPIYSVTQSKSTSFWGHDVLNSFNMVYGDEDSILDQTYQKQICSDFYYDDY